MPQVLPIPPRISHLIPFFYLVCNYSDRSCVYACMQLLFLQFACILQISALFLLNRLGNKSWLLCVTCGFHDKATIGCKLVSHQGFPFSSMRAGGHYHYAIMTFNRKVTIKTSLLQTKPQHTKQSNSMNYLQVSSGCSKAQPRPQTPPQSGQGHGLCMHRRE